MKHQLTALLLAAAAMTAGAQTTQKFTASKLNEYGLVYNLPLTAVDVTVEAEKTVSTPGEFYKYCSKYLGIKPITEPSTVWTVKSVTVTTRGVADEKEAYLVQFKNGSTPFMILDEHNFPLTVNDEDYEVQPSPQLPEAVDARPTILETAAARQAMTEDMLRSTSTAKRAELAAARIYELRQSRSDIMSGNADQAPTDGEGLKLVLAGLQQQEDALTAMFTGTRQVSTAVRTYTYVPDGVDDSNRVTVGRVSLTDGPVDADDLSGVPVVLSVNVTSRGKIPVNDKGEEKRFPKGGLAYRVPGSASLQVEVEGEVMADVDAGIAQYGIVFGIDPDMFTDKKAPAYVVFDAQTGAIREIGTR